MGVAFFSGEVLRLGQSSRKCPRRFLGHAHPPGHRLGIAESSYLVFIVPLRFVSALFEPEAEVLPLLYSADFGKRHPKTLLRRAAPEIFGEDIVVPCQGCAKLPFGVKIKPAKSQASFRLFRSKANIVGNK